MIMIDVHSGDIKGVNWTDTVAARVLGQEFGPEPIGFVSKVNLVGVISI